MSRTSVFSTFLVLLAMAGIACGQEDVLEWDSASHLESSDSKELARAKFEELRANRRDLLQQRADAARMAYAGLLEMYVGGRCTLDSLLELLDLCWDSALALEDTPANRLTVAEQRSLRAKVIERISNATLEATRVGEEEVTDVERRWNTPPTSAEGFLRARYGRLDAALRLAEVRAKLGKAGSGPSSLDLPEIPVTKYSKERQLAKDKFDAQRLESPEQLTREKIDIARAGHRVAWEGFLAGATSLEPVEEWSQRCWQTEQFLAGKDSNRLAAAERRWLSAKLAERQSEQLFAKGRIPVQDFLESRYQRLSAEIELVEASRRAAKEASAVSGALVKVSEREALGSREIRQVARAKFSAMHADIRDLAHARLQAAKSAYAAFQKMLKSPIIDLSSDSSLYWSLRWLEAELALARSPGERRAAFERHWVDRKLSEMISDARFQSGRIRITEYMLSRHYLLQVELDWAAARATEHR